VKKALVHDWFIMTAGAERCVESGLQKGIRSLLVRYILHKLRIWDSSTSNRVDHYVAKRIKKIYGKECHVICPPVDIHKFLLQKEKESRTLRGSHHG
jgi:hypothetical protein